MLAIVGGTGLYELPGLDIQQRIHRATPFGEPSGEILKGRFDQNEVLFLARHGSGHRLLPHEVNYRANVFALKQAGATMLLGFSAVGSLAMEVKPGDLAMPEQYFDWTRGNRQRTFFGGGVAGSFGYRRELRGQWRRCGFLAIGTTPVVQKAKQLTIPALYFTNLISARPLFGPAGAMVVACVGGLDPRREARALQAGVHLVVGTPGRLVDHIERGALDLSGLGVVVLDEADEMLDMGFREELEAILEALPAERRSLMFSATVPRPSAALAKRYQRDALRIEAAGEGAQHRDIEYRALLIAPHETERAVVNALRFFDAPRPLVFCRTRAAVARLHGNLEERVFAAVALSGELTQAERNRALHGLRDGRARVCVATDVAARGLHIPALDAVVNPANGQIVCRSAAARCTDRRASAR